jgi:hypothetical protein
MLVSAQPLNLLDPPGILQDTDNTTAWHVIASDGTGYTSFALMEQAGKLPWPNLPGGSMVNAMSLEAIASGGGAGSQIYYRWNTTITPSSGISVLTAVRQVTPGMIYNLWIQKTVGTDVVELSLFG